jgi:hypothetical protein
VAKRGREAALKRNREKSRQEKQEAKREKRSERRAEADDASPVDDEALMEEFARLSERYESGDISAEEYNGERQRILGELGIESPGYEEPEA